MLNANEVKTVKQLEAEIAEVLLVADEGVCRIVVANIVANRMNLDPVWLLLVAGSSGGKTEYINAISGLNFVHVISDLTVNTFASGFKKTGQETSLLLRINNGILAFKDFTSILSKNKDAKKEIMAQLREIYDGKYVKETGTGETIKWQGRAGAIAGSTEAIYQHLADMSAMGDRFIMYSIRQPDRIEMARKALSNTYDMNEKREHLKGCFTNYITQVINFINEQEDETIVELPEDAKEDLLMVADFATRVRSAVELDFKSGVVTFVPEPEMPTRMIKQLHAMATAFLAMKKSEPGADLASNKLDDLEKRLLYKLAFDSIPRTRRDTLHPLAQYRDGVTTSGMATLLNLPTPSVAKYLSQINALGICKRSKKGGTQGDLWKMDERYRNILVRLEGLHTKDGVLEGKGDGEEEVESIEKAWEQGPVNEQQEFDAFDMPM